MPGIPHLLNRWAPLLTGVLLVILIAAGGIDAHRHHGIEAYMAGVRTAIEAVPHRIGASVGSDVEPLAGAVRMLSPNKILQRRFIDPSTGSAMSLLIVHCGDVRDMLGHYPPVCYPAHGWRMSARSSMAIEIAGREEPIMVYQVSRTENLMESRITILNFFILPGNPAQIAPDMDDVERIARTQAAAGLGVAQIQIVIDGVPDLEMQVRTAREVVQALEPVVQSIAHGAAK
jgi:hypothetical protein